MHLFYILKSLAVITEPVIQLKVYKNFENIFLTKKTGHFLLHKDHNNTINLVNSK